MNEPSRPRGGLPQRISTQQVGRVAVTLTAEAVRTQPVSKLARVLERAVEAFHQPGWPTTAHVWKGLLNDTAGEMTITTIRLRDYSFTVRGWRLPSFSRGEYSRR